MVIGFFQVFTTGETPLTMMGARKTVPSRMERMVPLGDFHISVSWYSSTLCWLGVMVAHLTATPYCLVASAASTVTRSAVFSRSGRPRSK